MKLSIIYGPNVVLTLYAILYCVYTYIGANLTYSNMNVYMTFTNEFQVTHTTTVRVFEYFEDFPCVPITNDTCSQSMPSHEAHEALFYALYDCVWASSSADTRDALRGAVFDALAFLQGAGALVFYSVQLFRRRSTSSRKTNKLLFRMLVFSVPVIAALACAAGTFYQVQGYDAAVRASHPELSQDTTFLKSISPPHLKCIDTEDGACAITFPISDYQTLRVLTNALADEYQAIRTPDWSWMAAAAFAAPFLGLVLAFMLMRDVIYYDEEDDGQEGVLPSETIQKPYTALYGDGSQGRKGV